MIVKLCEWATLFTPYDQDDECNHPAVITYPASDGTEVPLCAPHYDFLSDGLR